MAQDETRKLALFDPLVDNRDEAISDEDDPAGEERPDAVPFFRHR